MQVKLFKKYIQQLPDDYDISLTKYCILKDSDGKRLEELGFKMEIVGETDENVLCDDTYVEVQDNPIIAFCINKEQKCVRFVVDKDESILDYVNELENTVQKFKGFEPKLIQSKKKK